MSKYTKRQDGRWQTKVYINRKPKYIYAPTRKELDLKIAEIRIDLSKGMDLTANKYTFKIWANSWLSIKQGDVSPATFKKLQYPLNHLLNKFADTPINKIKHLDIQELIQSLALNNPNTGKPASINFLKQVRDTARQIFQLAINNQALTFNPVNNVTIPTFTPPNKRRALTETEQSWILNTSHRAQTPAMIMMLSGLRRGEVIPLTWNDINLVENTIDINKTVNFDTNIPVIKKYAKTQSGIRKIKMPKLLSEYLIQQPKNSIYVTHSVNGDIHTQTSWKRMWESYLYKLNYTYGDFTGYPQIDQNRKINLPFVIPKITPHWLRHTYATLLYFAGVDILTAVEQMGHADTKTMLEIYTHLSNTYKNTQLDKLDDYMEHMII